MAARLDDSTRTDYGKGRRGKRMTIFLGESDQWHHRPLYMAILGLAAGRSI